MADSFYVGVDVGTGSARAGVFDADGKMLGSASNPIGMWRPDEDFAEQSSDNIWEACGKSIRDALGLADVQPEQIRGIGFDATCSLVALDAEDRPVTISPSGDDIQNVIVWMDHRAIEQAKRINESRHDVLRYVGGVISPEMQTPKLLWLKEHLPETWRRTTKFLDLPDFLVYRATGTDVRSLCTTTCKWTYGGHDGGHGWSHDFYNRVGLGDLADSGFARLGTVIRPMGEAVGDGLTETAAADLGLRAGTPVAVSIIDAHAGGVGLIGAAIDGRAPDARALESRLALIGGTSSCHMAVSAEPRFIDGIWGPYFSAMVPGLWLTEGGQSATGALIDHIIESHASGNKLAERAKEKECTPYDLLNERLDNLAEQIDFPAKLTKELHVLPYFHGNRSPRADPTLRGVVSGLKLGSSTTQLALQYYATIQAIAHGTRHIIDELNKHGYRIDTILACGGDTKNSVFVREHADATGCRIVLPREPEAVLLGSAILGAVASGDQRDVVSAMGAMSAAADVVEPTSGAVSDYHEAKHKVFQRMFDDYTSYREIMSD